MRVFHLSTFANKLVTMLNNWRKRAITIEITYVTFRNMLVGAAERILSAKEELTQIDSRFGDADHGVAMEKIALVIRQEAEQPGRGAKGTLQAIATRVMCINGGSAVPLWSTFFDGMANALSDARIDERALKAMFAGGLAALQDITTAKVGEKTMMDSIFPAVDAIVNGEGDISALMHAGAKAAERGAKDTERYVAKFGRAKNYKEQTLGTPDAGAVSAMYFFIGLDEGLK